MAEPKRTVVIVDDDADMARAVARLLTAAGFTTSTFPSGESLLGTLSGAPADCFIFDIHMPGMSGLDLAEQVRSSGIHIPIIFITAHDDARSRNRARHLGAAGFVIKPFESERLLELLSEAMP